MLPPQIAAPRQELVCYPAGHLKISPDNAFPGNFARQTNSLRFDVVLFSVIASRSLNIF